MLTLIHKACSSAAVEVDSVSVESFTIRVKSPRLPALPAWRRSRANRNYGSRRRFGCERGWVIMAWRCTPTPGPPPSGQG